MVAVKKSKRKVAAELVEQIDRLSARWHLSFSEVERNVIRDALARYASSMRTPETTGNGT